MENNVCQGLSQVRHLIEHLIEQEMTRASAQNVSRLCCSLVNHIIPDPNETSRLDFFFLRVTWANCRAEGM